MRYSEILAKLRKKRGYTQPDVAAYISRKTGKTCHFRNISAWETGKAEPSLEHFFLLCEFYGVGDIQETFREVSIDYRGMAILNTLGKSRVEEYIAMLSGNPLFVEHGFDGGVSRSSRVIRLYDVPVAAGAGAFLDSDNYEDFEVDGTVPTQTDYAVKVSGDSMTPRFIDGQIIFIKKQPTIEVGEIGIFALDGDAFIKKMGHGELISLNSQYEPIPINEYSSFYIFGKVLA
jgi:SOS-response transcriptional repressor LexA